MNVDEVKSALDERDSAIQEKMTALESENTELRQTVKELDDRLIPFEQAGHIAPGVHTKAHKYNVTRVFQAVASSRKALDGLELEVSQELAQKMPSGTDADYFIPMSAKAFDAGAESPTSGGADIIQTTVAREFIPSLQEESLYMALNPRQFQASGGPLHVPRVSSDLSGYIVSGDGEDITESEHTVNTVTFDPLYYSALTTVNRKVLDQSSPDVGRQVLASITRQIGVLVDQKAFVGTGTSEARGLVTAAANSVAANSPEDVSYGALVEMQKALIDDKVQRDNWVYVFSPAAWELAATTLKSTGDTASNFVLEMDGNGGWRACGFPAYCTTHLTGNTVLLYRTASAAYAWWGGLGLAQDPYGSNFASGSVSFRGMMPFDSDLLHDEAAATLNA